MHEEALPFKHIYGLSGDVNKLRNQFILHNEKRENLGDTEKYKMRDGIFERKHNKTSDNKRV